MLLDVHQMAIEGTDLGVIQSRAISVKSDTFIINGNTFHETLHTHAFDVKSKNVRITQNRFRDLEEQAFFKIQEVANNPG